MGLDIYIYIYIGFPLAQGVWRNSKCEVHTCFNHLLLPDYNSKDQKGLHVALASSQLMVEDVDNNGAVFD